jgi:hypothetical protein
MVEKRAKVDRFNWRLPLYAAVGALVVLLPEFYRADFWGVLGFFVIIPILSSVGLVAIAAVIRGQPRRSVAIVSALAAFCAVVWVLEGYEFKTRKFDGYLGPMITRRRFWHNRFLQMDNLDMSSGMAGASRVPATQSSISSSIRPIRSHRQPVVIHPENSKASPVKSLKFAALRTIGTPSCSIPIRTGAIAPEALAAGPAARKPLQQEPTAQTDNSLEAQHG